MTTQLTKNEQAKADAREAKAELKAESKLETKAGPRLVKMKRLYPQHPGGPLTADVHPEEVANYAKHGWLKE